MCIRVSFFNALKSREFSAKNYVLCVKKTTLPKSIAKRQAFFIKVSRFDITSPGHLNALKSKECSA